jgi:hypothetical protein
VSGRAPGTQVKQLAGPARKRAGTGGPDRAEARIDMVLCESVQISVSLKRNVKRVQTLNIISLME